MSAKVRNPKTGCRPRPGLRSSHFLALLVLFAAASTCLAESTNTLTLRSDLPNIGVSAVRALAALAIVLALFFAGVWLFRNGQRIAWRKNGAPRLAVLESRPLGNRLAIHVVGYDDQRLLIGSSPAGLSLLSQLPASATPPQPVAATAPAPSSSFADHLQRLLKRT